MTATPISWPKGKRIAVLASVLLETWSDGKAPSYFTRTTALKPGVFDRPAHQWSQYGGEEGIWRLLAVLERCGVSATVFANARCAELYPAAIEAIVRSGHHIAAHGYAQDQFLLDMTPEQQRATIRNSLDILEKHVGKRPEGWATSVYGWDEHTVELLVQEGVRWHADALNTSLPHLQKAASGTIVALPWSDFVDNRVLRASPRDFYNVYKDTFDYLYEQEPLGLLQVGFHSHFGGRPLMSAMVDKIFRYFASFPDVWFTTHAEIVQWFVALQIDQIPPAQQFFAARPDSRGKP
jgi:peptidoglycan/xylan/chitin deacetylase (PgdA/CDA1 family)